MYICIHIHVYTHIHLDDHNNFVSSFSQATNDIKRQELLDTEQMKFQQMQLDHDNVVSTLQKDIDSLMEELRKSKEETQRIKNQAELKSQQDAQAIRSQEEANEELSKQIIAKDTAVEQLERDKVSTKKEIEQVQNRLKELTLDGCHLLEDGESSVRKKMSSVRGLRLSTGMIFDSHICICICICLCIYDMLSPFLYFVVTITTMIKIEKCKVKLRPEYLNSDLWLVRRGES